MHISGSVNTEASQPTVKSGARSLTSPQPQKLTVDLRSMTHSNPETFNPEALSRPILTEEWRLAGKRAELQNRTLDFSREANARLLV